jgi:hypothetical protein
MVGREHHDLVTTRTARMYRQLRLVAHNLDDIADFSNEDFLTGVLPGNGVAVGLPTDEPIPCDPAQVLHHQRIRPAVRVRLQGSLLFFPGFQNDTMRRAMHSRQGHRLVPDLHLLAQIVQAAGVSAAEEVLPQIANPVLHFTFGLGTIRTTQTGHKTPIPGEVGKRGVEFHLPTSIHAFGEQSQHHRFGVVVEDFLRHATQIGERRFVHPQEGRQFLVKSDVTEHRPAISECEDKGIEFVASAVGLGDVAQIAPVHLCLLARRGLETAHRHGTGLLS